MDLMRSEPAWIVHRAGLERSILTLSLALYVAISCVSCIAVSELYTAYHIEYNPTALSSAAMAVALFAPVFLLFVLAEFSFGYLVGFYLSSVSIGYLWLSFFSYHSYDREPARISAAVSAIAFLLPVLFVTSPLPRLWRISVKSFDRFMLILLLASLATGALGVTYNFTIVSPGQASNFRTDSLPSALRYLMVTSSSTVLPFLFAYSMARKQLWRAAGLSLVMLLYYPIAVSKTAFFTPAWLVMIWFLSRLVGARLAVVLSLLLPVAVGVGMYFLGIDSGASPTSFFFNANFRMLAVPSLALDLYNEFFSTHEPTHFCQIGIIRQIFGCQYRDQLAVVMLHYFPGGGTYNASLLATEGIASVGRTLAPLSAFVCGLVIAAGNRASAGLPKSFVLISGAVLAQVLLTVPLSIVLVTHGGALMFLLWYVTPRELFERGPPP
jgi:hypothetical protein